MIDASHRGQTETGRETNDIATPPAAPPAAIPTVARALVQLLALLGDSVTELQVYRYGSGRHMVMVHASDAAIHAFAAQHGEPARHVIAVDKTVAWFCARHQVADDLWVELHGAHRPHVETPIAVEAAAVEAVLAQARGAS